MEIGGGDMGLVLPSYVEAGIVTVSETSQTLVIPHHFNRVPSDAWLIHLKEDYTETNQAYIMSGKSVINLKGRSNNNYIVRDGIMRSNSTGSFGGAANSSTSSLTEMDSQSVTFGKFNSYQQQFRQGDQYLYIIVNRNLPGDN
jgi:hypothetical protein